MWSRLTEELFEDPEREKEIGLFELSYGGTTATLFQPSRRNVMLRG